MDDFIDTTHYYYYYSLKNYDRLTLGTETPDDFSIIISYY